MEKIRLRPLEAPREKEFSRSPIILAEAGVGDIRRILSLKRNFLKVASKNLVVIELCTLPLVFL